MANAVGGVSVSDGGATVTAVLRALSLPSQAWCFGVTVYVQVPGGTAASVHVSPAIAPLQAAPTPWATTAAS